MILSTELLDLATGLAGPDTRRAAAQALALKFGARELLVFVRDLEVGVLLCVPGMRQRLPDGALWQAFIADCIRNGAAAAGLPLESTTERIPSVGFRASEDVVLVLVGVEHPNEEVAAFRPLLPLLGASFQREHRAAIAEAHMQIAEETARRAATLSAALDSARRQLANTNAELRAQASQLEDANHALHEQAAELEIQAEELAAAREIADMASRAKSEFLTTMSHELRTPLNAISGYVQLLQIGIHGPLTTAQKDALERVERSQRHLLALINDVLSIARIEAGTVHYQIIDADLRTIVEEIQPLIEPQVAAKHLHYRLEIPPNAVMARVDVDKLRQILLNLISNAIKFTPAGGTIDVSVRLDADQQSAHVTVRDTGIGIPPEKLESIFDPFVQVHSGGYARTTEGTGLGLAISRDLADGMGGKLTLVSNLGAGSTFTITLPAAVSLEV